MFSKFQWDWFCSLNEVPLLVTANIHARRRITKEYSIPLYSSGAADVHKYFDTTLLKLFFVFLVVIDVCHVSVNFVFGIGVKSFNFEFRFEKKLKNVMPEYTLWHP